MARICHDGAVLIGRRPQGDVPMTERLHNFVDGAPVEAKDGRTTPVVDPSTGETYAEAPLSGPEDVDLACQAAATAFERLAGHHAVGAQPHAAEAGRRHRGPGRGFHRGRGPQHRQAAGADPLGGDPADARSDPVLRRRGPGPRGPRPPASTWPATPPGSGGSRSAWWPR